MITLAIAAIIAVLAGIIVGGLLASQKYEHIEKKWFTLHQQQPETINLTSIQQWTEVEKEMRDTMFPPFSQFYLYEAPFHEWHKHYQKKLPKDIRELCMHAHFYGYEIHIQHKEETL